MRYNYFFIVYGCDYAAKGRACGPETIARLRALAAHIVRYRLRDVAVILCAEKAPDATSLPLKNLMKEFLYRRFLKEVMACSQVDMPAFILPKEHDHWSAFSETAIAAAILHEYDATDVCIVTSWYHVYRSIVTWSIVSNVSTYLITSKKAGRWWRPLLEVPKFAKLCLDWRTWKRTKKTKRTSPRFSL